MAKEKFPVTAALRFLRQHKISYESHLYSYEEKGGTAASARELGVDEHQVIKTLIFETDEKVPLIVLMHGDRQVSAKQLAREIGARSLTPCSPKIAQKHTGYLVGGTSPFGCRKAMPVYLERTIMALPCIYINGGKRGFLVSLTPQSLQKVLSPIMVDVAIE